jgi:hypothetical protein
MLALALPVVAAGLFALTACNNDDDQPAPQTSTVYVPVPSASPTIVPIPSVSESVDVVPSESVSVSVSPSDETKNDVKGDGGE